MDLYEFVLRGSIYIEGIVIVFESRNYIVIFIVFLIIFVYVFLFIWVVVIVVVICFLLVMKFMLGSVLKDIVDIEYIKFYFDGLGLFVDNIYMMNIGFLEK